MKKIVVFLLGLFCVVSTYSQEPSIPMQTKDYYLQISKNQKNTGLVLLGAGTAMAIGGIIGFNASWNSSSDTTTDIYGFVMIGGVLADLASIPFFISSSRNKKKALSITVSGQNILQPQNNSLSLKVQPALTLRIKF